MPTAGGGDLGWLGPLLGGGAGLYGLTQANQMSNPGLNQEQQNLIGAGQNTYNTALDPRHELYGRTAQQLQDQVRSSDSAHGVAMSPFSAGVENKAMSDFNIDWNNAQLGRQVAGTGALAGANQAATGIGQLGLGNRQFGAGQTGANTNAFLTALSRMTGGATGMGGAGGPNYLSQWLNSIMGRGAPAGGGFNDFTGGMGPGGQNLPAAPPNYAGGQPDAGGFDPYSGGYTFDNSGSGMPMDPMSFTGGNPGYSNPLYSANYGMA